MRTFFLAACCLASALAQEASVSAATPQAALARLLLRMHSDGVWPAIDHNQDQQLSRQEIEGFNPKDPATAILFSEADTNNDGLLAFVEIQAAIGKAVAVQIIAAPGSRKRVDAQVVFTRDTAFISDYDIAVNGDGQGTPDPVIKVIRTGTALSVDNIHLTQH